MQYAGKEQSEKWLAITKKIRERMESATGFAVNTMNTCVYSHKSNGVGCALGCLMDSETAGSIENMAVIDLIFDICHLPQREEDERFLSEEAQDFKEVLDGLFGGEATTLDMLFGVFMQSMHDSCAISSLDDFSAYKELLDTTIGQLEWGQFCFFLPNAEDWYVGEQDFFSLEKISRLVSDNMSDFVETYVSEKKALEV